jgi:carboxyl-terminal processing protease
LRIGRDGDGFAVKGIIPGTAAERAGLALGDRVLAVGGKPYGLQKVNFRELFLALEGPAGSTLEVLSRPLAGGSERSAKLERTAEEPGDALVWKSARVIRHGGRRFGYARLWGLNSETALAIVDLLLDRAEVERVHARLSGWGAIEGFLLDARANSGGYDPNILATFLRGRWSSGDYYRRTREGRRLVPPEYKPLPVVLLVNSATASAGEALALQVRRHAIGRIVGEKTAGMATGGAFSHRLPDGSWLWVSNSRVEDEKGRAYEGEGLVPDVLVADRPAAASGEEETIVEAGLRILASRKP